MISSLSTVWCLFLSYLISPYLILSYLISLSTVCSSHMVQWIGSSFFHCASPHHKIVHEHNIEKSGWKIWMTRSGWENLNDKIRMRNLVHGHNVKPTYHKLINLVGTCWAWCFISSKLKKSGGLLDLVPKHLCWKISSKHFVIVIPRHPLLRVAPSFSECSDQWLNR